MAIIHTKQSTHYSWGRQTFMPVGCMEHGYEFIKSYFTTTYSYSCNIWYKKNVTKWP